MPTTPFDAARAALSRLHEAGHPGWMVGGCVRDHLLGEPTDRLTEIDLVTAAPVAEIERLFRPTVPVGRAFGILRVRHAGVWFEVATLRAEAGETADLTTDARHRDFTINALYWDPDRGGIVDVVSGRRDLEARLVRGVADPEARFREDPLRTLRAVRFGAWRDFRLEAGTLAAAQRVAPALSGVAFERVKDELAKIATRATIRRGDAWRTLVALGLLPLVFPEVSGGDTPEATASVLDRLACRTLPLFLAAVTRRALPPWAPARRWVLLSESMKQRLKLSSEEEKATAELLAQRQRYEGFARLGLARRRLLATRGDRREAEDLLAAEQGSEEVLRALVELRERYGAERPPPLLDGGTLKAAGLPPGPGFGRRLRRARLLQLAGRVSTRAEALRAIGVASGS